MGVIRNKDVGGGGVWASQGKGF